MAENYRIEKDSMGELEVPKEALYGAETQRAINNFPVSGLTLPPAFIRTIALIKKRRQKLISAWASLNRREVMRLSRRRNK